MMTLMFKVFAAVLFTLPIVSAQITPIFVDFPPQLKSYLELTDDQVTAIKKANMALSEFRMTKLQRQFQVQIELGEETAKQTPDPMAMGLRYVELEAIRRELQAEQEKTVAAVQKVLTAPQKTKLSVLQQAFLLYGTACSAVDQNLFQPRPTLLSGRNTIPSIRIDPTPTSFASFLLGPPGITACGGATGVIRNGEFTFNQAPTLE
jgi:hypothetical protein